MREQLNSIASKKSALLYCCDAVMIRLCKGKPFPAKSDDEGLLGCNRRGFGEASAELGDFKKTYRRHAILQTTLRSAVSSDGFESNRKSKLSFCSIASREYAINMASSSDQLALFRQYDAEYCSKSTQVANSIQKIIALNGGRLEA